MPSHAGQEWPAPTRLEGLAFPIAESRTGRWYEWAASLPPASPRVRLPASNHTAVVRTPETATGHSGGCFGWADLVASLWPPEQVAHACAIIGRESNGQPSARNRSGASGLFQLMLPTHCGRFEAAGYSCSDWSNPTANATVAYGLWLDAGWSPWAASGG